MGALDHLGTDPLPSDGRAENLRDVARWTATVNDLLDEEKYQFAADTLTGIRDTFTAAGYVTQGQKDAILNIRAGGDRHEDQDRRWKRRYEGA